MIHKLTSNKINQKPQYLSLTIRKKIIILVEIIYWTNKILLDRNKDNRTMMEGRMERPITPKRSFIRNKCAGMVESIRMP